MEPKSKLGRPDQPVTPELKRLDSSILHVPAREVAAVIPAIEARKVDVVINNLIDIFPDLPENLVRNPYVVPLAMHVTSRSHARDRDREPKWRHAEATSKRIPSRRADCFGMNPRYLSPLLGISPGQRVFGLALHNRKNHKGQRMCEGGLRHTRGPTQPCDLCDSPCQTLPNSSPGCTQLENEQEELD